LTTEAVLKIYYTQFMGG